MKKIITFIMALVMTISFTACANKGNTTTEIIGETSFPGTTFNVNGHTIDLPFYGIEDAFILDMADLYGVNTKFYVYGTDELTTEILEHRTEKDGFIIERCIGMVTNRENAGDLYIGKVSANSFSALKRLASKKCNNYFKAFDTMTVCRANDEDMEKEIRFTRANKKSPNNTIVRGCWKQ